MAYDYLVSDNSEDLKTACNCPCTGRLFRAMKKAAASK
jgi:hypothetical protein